MPEIPKPVYPIAIDSDYTLFKTYNSSQSALTYDLSEDATEIFINPKTANEGEVWPDNGFIKVGDELIYYDSVEKNENGKIFKLLDCIRGVEELVDSYKAGTPIYGTVVAQTHNQLVDAVVQIEETIGDLKEMLNKQPLMGFDAPKSVLAANAPPPYQPEKLSLHANLADMFTCAPVGDDTCPDVEFEVNDIDDLTIEFCVRIFGNFTSFQIDFDDGNIETQQLAGIHTYAVAAEYNQKVLVVAPECCILQQATAPNQACEGVVLPSPAVPFHLRIPERPAFPEFVAPKQICPGPLLNLPPILHPELNLCDIASIIPVISGIVCPSVSVVIDNVCPTVISVFSPCEISILSFVGCDIPSIISCVGCDFPSVISCDCPSITQQIEFGPAPSFAPIEFVNVPTFDCISFCDPPSFAPIEFAPFPSVSPVSFEVIVNLSTDCISFCSVPTFSPIKFEDPPTISVDFGTPPLLSCIVSVVCPTVPTPSDCPETSFAASPPLAMAAGRRAFHDPGNDIPVTLDDIGIPEEIRIIPPKMPEEIRLRHDLPTDINLKVPQIPDIRILGPEKPLPEKIEVVGKIPDRINLVAEIPTRIQVDAPDIPKKILVELAPNFPSVFKLEPSGPIEVTGIPKSIEIVHDIPKTIQLLMPENPTVEMKYSGAPIDFNINLNLDKALSDIIIVNP